MLCVVLSLPSTQTYLGKHATAWLKKEFKVDINIDEVAINPFGGIKLKGILIKDHKNDTLAHIKLLNTDITDYKVLYDKGHPYFDNLNADGLNFKIHQYKGEKDTNLDKFVAAFEDTPPKPSTGKFRLKANSIGLKNSRFRFIDDNLENPKIVDFTNLSGQLDNFFIKGSNVYAYAYQLKFKDHRGLEIKNLTSDFTYTKTNILLNNLEVKTANSSLKGRTELLYNRKDFADFNNKVNFDLDIKEGQISSNDLNFFYNEFGKNQKFYIDSHIKGTLNNLTFNNLKLTDLNDNEIKGKLQLFNILGKQEKNQEFRLKGNFDRLSVSQVSISKVLPNLLGKNLPKQLQKLGKVDLKGDVELTQKWINADIDLYSKLGHVVADFKMDKINNIDKATYDGVFKLDKFDLGSFLDQKELGKSSVNLAIKGTGFSKKYLNTKLKGNIGEFKYNGYAFKNIEVDGLMKMPYFKGFFDSKDPNLNMTFNGLLDLSKKRRIYDFEAKIKYANLKKINLYTKDKVAILSGNISMNANGNNLEDLAGTINLENISYINPKTNYYFENAHINSSFDQNNVRTITLNSTDMIDGKVVGKYKTNQLSKMMQNAVGSLYANYVPHQLQKNQFIDFDFTVFNKILEVFYPDITVAENTFVKGKINSDTGMFQFDLKSPLVNVFGNKFSNLNVDIDNKNPLYNTYIQSDSIITDKYKLSDFSLINLTLNDTLFVRSEFKGGSKAEDKFDLNIYHTIDANKQSVVGFKKSDITFKNYQWYINENETNDNKITFDKQFKDFNFNKLTLSHNNQFIDLTGVMKDSTYKDFKVNMQDVDIAQVTPDLGDISITGKINGIVNYKQNKNFFDPSTNLKVENLSVNDITLGNMELKVNGDEYFKKFNVNASLINNNEETFLTTGIIEFVNKKPILNLDTSFQNFDIKPIGTFLKGIVDNVRGKASGQATIVGTLDEPEIDGILYLDEAGLKVPVLNVDYNFEKNSVLNLTEEKFIFRDINISDVNETTKGVLKGVISHKKLSNWELDLKIESDRLLVLDTKDSDDAYYYGKAYFDGFAIISGPVQALVIQAKGQSAKGTALKIPVNTTESVGESSLVHFITNEEKFGLTTKKEETATYQGITLDFDFDVNRNAEIEVILNKETGHAMKGVGEGSIKMEINTLGKFQMNGDYNILEGDYLFRYGGLINKPFKVKKGGTINWSGDPLGAVLNLEAVYEAQANPGVMVEGASFNKKVPVQVVIDISGELGSPQTDYNINFPNVDSVLKSELDYQLQNKDTRQIQSFALLATGSFSAPNNLAYTGSLIETAKGLFNDVLANADNKMQVIFDYQLADKQRGISDKAIVILSTNISDRIKINGGVAVPVGSVNQSFVVGNVEVELILNSEGNLTAHVFNKENDVNYNTLGQNIGYTQGAGFAYNVDFDTFKELLNKLFKSKKKEEKNKANNKSDDLPDSEISPEFINFIDEARKKQSKENKKDPKKDEKPKENVPLIND